jgi:hypothetical protein
LITLAGLAAEHRFTGKDNWRGARSDASTAFDLAFRVYSSPKVCEKYIAFMVERAKEFVACPPIWVGIESIAAALLEHQKLSARQALAICRQSVLNQIR